MWSIRFIAAILLLLLVVQSSNAKKLNVASGIANRQLTIEESFPHLATTSSNDQINCTICLKHVDLTESAAPDNSSNRPFPCGHGKNIHQTCFEKYLEYFTGRSNAVRCSYCTGPLQLTNAQKALIGTHTQETGPLSPIDMAAILERWPRIIEIGHATMMCGDGNEIFVLQCASAVLHGYVQDVVSPMMNQYLANQDDFLRLQRLQNLRHLYSFSEFPVYTDVDGNLITIGKAYRRSLHSIRGEPYFGGLQNIETSIRRLPNQYILRKLSQFPELADFKDEYFQKNGKTIGTFYDAATLLCIESLNTQVLDQMLQEVNDQVVQAKVDVDEFLQRTYPNLVELKTFPIWEDFHYTIEHLATIILHPSIRSDRALSALPRMNDGAETIKQRVDQYIMNMYGHCEGFENLMRLPLGQDTTLYTVIKFTLNPGVYSEEKQKWIDAINRMLRKNDCTPKDVPAIMSEEPNSDRNAGNSQHRISNA